jgi:hypothetical protein
MRLDGLLDLLDEGKPQRRIPGAVASFVTGAAYLIAAAKLAALPACERMLCLKVSFYGNRLTFGGVITRTYCHADGTAFVGGAARCRTMSVRQRRAIDCVLNAGAVFYELGKRDGIERQQTVFPHR